MVSSLRTGILSVALIVLAACAQVPPAQPQAKLAAQAVSQGVVISQVYGGGGNSGAPYTHDFVELFNRGTTPVSLNGWSIQYASATGTGNFGASSTLITELPNVTLQPGQYFLVQQAGGTVGAALPAPDFIDSTPIAMAAGAGKVALVSSTSPLGCNGGSTPCSPAQLAQIIDLVGYGNANFFEGAGAAPTLSNTTAALRKDNGCTETDNNAADFEAAGPNPRNTASARNFCDESAPSVVSTTPAAGGTINPDANLTLTFSEPVNVSGEWFSIACSSSGTRSVADTVVTANATSTQFVINPNTDFVSTESCTLTVFAAQVSDVDTLDPPDTMTANFELVFNPVSVCDLPYTPIYQIQGSGLSAAITGSVTTRGVVVGDYEGPSPALRGFYIQDPTGDGDANTSDGIFVFNGNNDSVSLGDVVRVVGTAAEFQDQTQISATTITKCGTGTVTPVDVTLPFASPTEAERYEGMLVRLPQTLYVTEHFQLGRFGQVVLSSGGRLKQPTNVTTPGAAANALQAQNNLNRIILDDALQNQNPDPILFGRNGQPLSASNTLRGGDTATGIVGVMTYTWAGNAASGNAYRVRPIGALNGYVNFVAANPRPTTAPDVGGTLRVVGFNLLNFFNTFDGLPDTVDNCTNGVGGPPTDCRGADTLAEFNRQWPKTVAAILAMNPDVLGFNEMENDGYGPDSAIAFLVNKLNEATAPGTYAFIDADAATGQVNALGTDAIKVGLIYKPARVTPVGQTAVLNTPAFVNGGDSAPRNRASLAQAFQQNDNGAIFIVNVNHLKSKGSACDLPDQGDGQGNCNVVRTNAAQQLAAWLATNPTGIADPDILLIGDYNSYAKEDPITALKNAGYINLIENRLGDDAYSYVFDGQWGYLDHALASPSLNAQVSGVAEYHINADEPSVLDYNTDFKTPNLQALLYAPDQYRVSDHDPVVVGLSLTAPGAWFFGPVAPFPAFNTVNAGQSIPLIFSLGGNKGLNIFAPGYPRWQVVPCGSSAAVNGTNPTSSNGGLSYDPLQDRYTYPWKTEKSWAGSCRQVVVRYIDGITYRANFNFVK
ncbi:ExeM/NucH family extracellular endonuclease [Meiothermus cerbereus]|uniref:ExeM/NucH family extracellular endonuclease n=1 Tax=Meiothermus cerbereus TaxID=65552 RepID=UPI002FDB199B